MSKKLQKFNRWRRLGLGLADWRTARGWGIRTLTSNIRGYGRVTLRLRESDADMFRQTFYDLQYDLSRLKQNERIQAAYAAILAAGDVPVIVDAGANVGAASLWFARLYPQAKVVALEPDPQNAALCRANTASCGNVIPVEAAIGASSGWARLIGSDSTASFQTERVEEGGGGVKVLGIADAVALAGPRARLFIAKIDIEGFEADLFACDTGWIDQAAAIFIEPHDWMFPGQHRSDSFQTALAGRGLELLIVHENLVYVR